MGFKPSETKKKMGIMLKGNMDIKSFGFKIEGKGFSIKLATFSLDEKELIKSEPFIDRLRRVKERSKHRYLSDLEYFNYVRRNRGTTKAVKYILKKDISSIEKREIPKDIETEKNYDSFDEIWKKTQETPSIEKESINKIEKTQVVEPSSQKRDKAIPICDLEQLVIENGKWSCVTRKKTKEGGITPIPKKTSRNFCKFCPHFSEYQGITGYIPESLKNELEDSITEELRNKIEFEYEQKFNSLRNTLREVKHKNQALTQEKQSIQHQLDQERSEKELLNEELNKIQILYSTIKKEKNDLENELRKYKSVPIRIPCPKTNGLVNPFNDCTENDCWKHCPSYSDFSLDGRLTQFKEEYKVMKGISQNNVSNKNVAETVNPFKPITNSNSNYEHKNHRKQKTISLDSSQRELSFF